MRVRNENEIDLRKIVDFATGASETFHEKNPVSEIGINQEIQIGELAEERGVADPGDGDLSFHQLRECWGMAMSVAGSEPAFPDHLIEESAGIEMVARGKFLERPGNAAFTPVGSSCSVVRVHCKYL